MANRFIKITRGDITESTADAIVNAANNRLWMGAGVAGAIKQRGGQKIEDEAVAQGPIQVGEAVITTAGTLPSKYVIHAAVMGQDLRTDENKIWMATYNSLQRAEELNLVSIDFPALGTGVGGFPLNEAAGIMIEAARKFLGDSNSLKIVGLVLFDDNAYNAFKTALGADNLEV